MQVLIFLSSFQVRHETCSMSEAIIFPPYSFSSMFLTACFGGAEILSLYGLVLVRAPCLFALWSIARYDSICTFIDCCFQVFFSFRFWGLCTTVLANLMAAIGWPPRGEGGQLHTRSESACCILIYFSFLQCQLAQYFPLR